MTLSNHRQGRPSHTQDSGVSTAKKTAPKVSSVVSWTDRFEGREEPALREMIEDPIMVCLMASDGLTAASVLEIVNAAKLRQGIAVKELA